MVTRREFLKSLVVSAPIAVLGLHLTRQRRRVEQIASGLAPAPSVGVAVKADPMNHPMVYLPSGADGQKMAIRGRRRRVHRPPGARPEEEFARYCLRCRKCVRSCPNHTLLPDEDGMPKIAPRTKGCMLCMTCNQGCPSGALQKVENDDFETIQSHVKMGVAVVDRSSCYSYTGSICGVCIEACSMSVRDPKPSERHKWPIRGGHGERPVINADKCVGCGLCVQVCLMTPQAIRVVPLEDAV